MLTTLSRPKKRPKWSRGDDFPIKAHFCVKIIASRPFWQNLPNFSINLPKFRTCGPGRGRYGLKIFENFDRAFGLVKFSWSSPIAGGNFRPIFENFQIFENFGRDVTDLRIFGKRVRKLGTIRPIFLIKNFLA